MLLLLIPILLLLSVAIPTVEILLEIDDSQATNYREHNSSIFIAYYAFNIGRHLFTSCVRLMMAIAAIEVGRYGLVQIQILPFRVQTLNNLTKMKSFLKTGKSVAMNTMN